MRSNQRAAARLVSSRSAPASCGIAATQGAEKGRADRQQIRRLIPARNVQMEAGVRGRREHKRARPRLSRDGATLLQESRYCSGRSGKSTGKHRSLRQTLHLRRFPARVSLEHEVPCGDRATLSGSSLLLWLCMNQSLWFRLVCSW